MSTRTKIAGATFASVALVGAGSAVAANGGGTLHKSTKHVQASRSAKAARGDAPGGGPLAAAAAYLGLTADALKTQLDGGKTLAQVAQAQGKTADGLVDALVADLKTHLDAAVTAGRLGSAEETSILAKAKTRLATQVSQTPPKRQGADLMQAAATYLGLTLDQLHTQLAAGSSLAQVAQAQGKTVDGLKQALTTAFQASLDDLVNATPTDVGGGPGFGPGGHGGPGGPGFFGGPGGFGGHR